MRPIRVAIIGGGVTGMTAAYHLQEQSKERGLPLECTLFEATSRLGGKIQTHRDQKFWIELGPDSIFTAKPDGVTLLRELGISDQIIHAVSGQTSLARNHTLFPIPRDLYMGIPARWSAMAMSPLLSPRGKLRALGDLVLPRTSELETLSLGHLLRLRFGHEVVEQIAAPLLAGIHAADIDRMGIADATPAIEHLIRTHRSLLLGAKRSKERTQRPASQSASSPFISLQGGLSTLTEALFAKTNEFVHYKTNAPVKQLKKNPDGSYTFVYLSDNVPTRFEADAVILATPAHAAAAIVETLGITTDLLPSIRYASTATVILGFAAATFPEQREMTGFLVPRSAGLSITACTVVSTKWPSSLDQKQVVVRCYVGRDGSEEILKQSDEDIVKAVEDDLHAIWKVKRTPAFYRLTRWPISMPQYDVGHANRVARMEQALHDFPGLAMAGAAYRGMGIPDCIKDGKRAATHVLKHVTQIE